jgi:hypothetical protein
VGLTGHRRERGGHRLQVRAGRVHSVTLPPADLAVTTHVGEHDGVEVTYGELRTWVYGTRCRWPGRCARSTPSLRDTPDPAAWRTEIGWPVFRLT